MERYGRCSCWIKNNNYGEVVHAMFTGCSVAGSTGSLRYEAGRGVSGRRSRRSRL